MLQTEPKTTVGLHKGGALHKGNPTKWEGRSLLSKSDADHW